MRVVRCCNTISTIRAGGMSSEGFIFVEQNNKILAAWLGGVFLSCGGVELNYRDSISQLSGNTPLVYHVVVSCAVHHRKRGELMFFLLLSRQSTTRFAVSEWW